MESYKEVVDQKAEMEAEKTESDAKLAKEKLFDTLVSENKIPAKYITPEFKKLTLALSTDEEVKAAVEDRRLLASKVVNDTKDITTSEKDSVAFLKGLKDSDPDDKNGKVTDDDFWASTAKKMGRASMVDRKDQ